MEKEDTTGQHHEPFQWDLVSYQCLSQVLSKSQKKVTRFQVSTCKR